MAAVSVIVPIYNVVQYVGECIESILNQTFQDIEIILVNDGSTDGSDKIAKDFARQNDKIILISQKNAGLSAARNKGLQAAGGKYVYFIDSDDFLAPAALERLWEVSEREQLDILYFAAHMHYESKQMQRQYANSYLRKGSYPKTVSGKNLLTELIRNQDYIASACLQFIRREYLEDRGICFCEGIIHEDNLFTFETMVKAGRTRCISDLLYYRRMRSDSIMTAKKTAANLEGYFKAMLGQVQIAAQEGGTQEQEAAMLSVIRSIAKILRNMYCQVGQPEREKFLNTCRPWERCLFQGVMLAYIGGEEMRFWGAYGEGKNMQGNHASNKFVLVRKVKTAAGMLRQQGIRETLRFALIRLAACL